LSGSKSKNLSSLDFDATPTKVTPGIPGFHSKKVIMGGTPGPNCDSATSTGLYFAIRVNVNARDANFATYFVAHLGWPVASSIALRSKIPTDWLLSPPTPHRYLSLGEIAAA